MEKFDQIFRNGLDMKQEIQDEINRKETELRQYYKTEWKRTCKFENRNSMKNLVNDRYDLISSGQNKLLYYCKTCTEVS